MSRFLALTATFAALSALAGCDESVACTTEARASALIRVDGPVTSIRAEDANGDAVEVVCADDEDEATCTRWTVGWEVEGEITVYAEASDGCNTGSGSVTVNVPLDASGCHVVTQEADLSIDAWTDMDCG